MKIFSSESLTYEKFKKEIVQGSGVVNIKNVYSKDQISLARDIVNKFADTQESKETHFNAEAEASGKLHLQQRVWNLFGKDKIFSKLITHDIIFNLMSKLLGSKFIAG